MEIDTQLDDEILIIKPKGWYTDIYPQTYTVHEIVKNHIEKGCKKYILDLDGVEFLDSTGVGDIFASYSSLNEAGGELATVVTKSRLKLIFQVIRAYEILGCVDSIEEAKRNLSL